MACWIEATLFGGVALRFEVGVKTNGMSSSLPVGAESVQSLWIELAQKPRRHAAHSAAPGAGKYMLFGLLSPPVELQV